MAVGMLGWVWGFVLRLLPLENFLPGGGQKEVAVSELNRMNSLALRRPHTSEFYRKHSIIDRRGSTTGDVISFPNL